MFSKPSRRVKIIGKIRSFTNQESQSLSQDFKSWITVHKPLESASSETKVEISFSEQSSSRKNALYELDYCYEQDEDIKTIYSREIKPLILDVFGGKSASVFAYGARGSGKTSTIQGTEKMPGLAVMALSELLMKADENEKLVSISLCEIFQEHVYDLLDSKHPEVQVLEDVGGRINLKRLSQVYVKSISEIENIYFNSSNLEKSVQKILLEQPKRSHKLTIINVSDNSNCKLVGKMNFVDLAGYVDVRRLSADGSTLTESTRINKSLNVVLNVVHALNTNESHVPYRESKLTHMLKESLGGRNHVLMVTCLNPLFCQDTIHTLSLASRSCRRSNYLLTNLKTKANHAARMQVLSSQKFVKPTSTPAVVKKKVASDVKALAKKGSPMMRERVLFDDQKKVTSNNKAKSGKDVEPVVMFQSSYDSDSIQAECANDADSIKMSELHVSDSNSYPDVAMAEFQLKEPSGQPVPDDSTLALVPFNQVVLEDNSITNHSSAKGCQDIDILANNKNNSEATPLVACNMSLLENGNQNDCLQNDKISPPLSERFKEISNNLKLFCSATSLRLKMSEEVGKQHNNTPVAFNDSVEPRTPKAQTCVRFNGKMEIATYFSPWEKFSHRSTGMKNTLVDECLEFLNTASKEDLKKLKGIGEKRASYILERRENSAEPFKRIEDLEDIGLSAKQVKGIMKKMASELFS